MKSELKTIFHCLFLVFIGIALESFTGLEVNHAMMIAVGCMHSMYSKGIM